VTLVIGILVMMLTISWKLTLIALVVLPVSMFIIQFIVKKSQKYFKTAQDEIGNLNGHIEESLSGQTTLSVFSGEKQAALNFEKHNNALYASTWKSQFISGLMFPVMHFVSNLGYVATAIAGGYLVINQAISIGDLSAFIQYVNQFNQPLTQLSQVMNILQSAIAAGERVFNFLEEDEEKLISTMYSSSTLRDDFPGRSKILTPEKSSQAALAKSLCLSEHIVEFRDVNFSYDPKKPLIEGFNLKVKRGEKIAIVGPTGAGKTTIVNLLMRFYDPTAGEILIDGVRSVDMERGEVREKFGMVLQDTWLFDGTIEENLKYGKLGASKSELERAIKTAQIEHIVESLPNGLKTKIDEDSEIISAGEKQLLTIARAMVADPEMMILDEATSSVDTRTEILIQQAFDKLTKGRTSFIIAHRLSTIRNADKILVMKEGRIVESGGHMELLALNGAYAELYNSQFSEG
jgi:ATP-binding cassette subfamily B protein